MATQSSIFPSPELVGQFRRFGELGTAYEIMNPVRKLKDKDWLLRIKVVKTGEELEYQYSNIINDPVAH